MARQLRLGDAVFLHLQNIRDYYAERNPDAGEKIWRAIEEALNRLVEAPQRFPACHFAPARFQVVERYPNYSVIYTYDDDVIRVHAVWDNRQDPRKLEALLTGEAR